MFSHPCLNAGNFNGQHVDWGYNANSADGKLVGWANTNYLALFYNPKNAASFHSGRWNTSTNQDLAFVSIDLDSRLLDRHDLENFLRSRYQPLLITPPRFARPVPSKPAKRWNFRKAKRIATILLLQTNLPGLCRHLIHPIWISHISVSVTPSALLEFQSDHFVLSTNFLFKFNVSLPLVTGELLQNTVDVNNVTYKLYNIKI